MTSAMTSCADWLNSTPAETKVEPFGLSPWSQQKTGPRSEMPQSAALQVCSRLHQLCACAVYLKRHFAAQSNIVAWLYRKTRVFSALDKTCSVEWGSLILVLHESIHFSRRYVPKITILTFSTPVNLTFCGPQNCSASYS